MFKNIPYLIAGALLLAMLFFGFKQKEEDSLNSYRPSGEQKLPDVSFRTLEGNSIRLSQLQGKVVLLSFWAIWCSSCREEMRTFEREYKRCKDKGFEVLAVNMDGSEETIKRFLKENPYSFRVARPSEEVEREFKLMGFPTSYLLDRNGNVYRIRFGIYRELEKDLKELLGC